MEAHESVNLPLILRCSTEAKYLRAQNRELPFTVWLIGFMEVSILKSGSTWYLHVYLEAIIFLPLIFFVNLNFCLSNNVRLLIYHDACNFIFRGFWIGVFCDLLIFWIYGNAYVFVDMNCLIICLCCLWMNMMSCKIFFVWVFWNLSLILGK